MLVQSLWWGNEAIDIPFEIIDLICWHLDPFSLARTACVSKTWQEAASADVMWKLFVRSTPKAPHGASNQQNHKAVLGKLATGAPAGLAAFSILHVDVHQETPRPR